jgi:hypothetical protein
MPERRTVQRARRARREGQAPTTQAGEFVREEIEHVRKGKHGARSARQAIAIGLSKARRAGVALPPPPRGRTSEGTRRRAQREAAAGQGRRTARARSARRSRASREVLRREPRGTASPQALARQARQARTRRSRRR